MPAIPASLTALVLGAGIACHDVVLAPSSHALAGRWSSAPERLSPRGEFIRTLEFSTDGQYVRAVESRGVYSQLPAESIGSFTREYGSYVLAADTLRLAQDSVRSWDYLGGEYFRVGPEGMYIEGPPTPPVVELTRTRLTLRFMVNPGAGYVPVVQEYRREP